MTIKRSIYIILFAVFFLTPSAIITSSAQGGSELGLRTVVIDPGHGGKDPGALGKTRKTDEKHVVLSVSKKLGKMINDNYPDVKVVYTRSSDSFVELKERANIAKRNKADLFISIHCNSVGNTKAYGASAWILGPKSTRNPKNTSNYFEKSQSVAQRENSVMLLEDDYKTSYQDFNPDSPESVIGNNLLWMANYENSLLFASEFDNYIHKAPYRVSSHTGIHQDVFYLLWATNMPAALLEIGFISNPSDYAVMITDDGQEKIARSIFNAFSNYKKKYDASVGASPAATVPPAASETTVQKQETSSEQHAAEVKVEKPAVEKSVAPAADVYYGVQIMGLGRKLSSGDPAFKGLPVRVVEPYGNVKVYRYVAGCSETLEGAKANLSEVRRKFPDSFLVKVSDQGVVRIK